jgi:hypothetical protein
VDTFRGPTREIDESFPFEEFNSPSDQLVTLGSVDESFATLASWVDSI